MRCSGSSSRPQTLNPSDSSAVSAQLGREPRGRWRVTSRCPEGAPQVIAVAPTLKDGSPFPTTFWLTCPRLVEAIGALESQGANVEWAVRVAAGPGFGARRLAADEANREARDAEGAEPRLDGVGVAGQRDPLAVKCLHARVAAYLSGTGDPVGEAVAAGLSVACPCDARTRCLGESGPADGDVSDER